MPLLALLLMPVIVAVALVPLLRRRQFPIAPSRVQSVYLGPRRFSQTLARTMPEVVWMRLVAVATSYLDLRLSPQNAHNLRTILPNLLDEMTRSGEYTTLAPALWLSVWG
ncbi:MAG: hypothetical protein ACRCZF_22735, partial [Gemmataceae bacterium]